MPARPSNALLGWLRTLIDQRGSSVADLAARTQLDRAHLRKVLAGAESMTVDELLLVTQALELAPKDFGLPADDAVPAEAAPAAEDAARPQLGVVPDVADAAEPTDRPALDPWGNHPEQLVRAGFALGCDFQLVADTPQLGASGVPKAVLERHARELVLKFDAAYHSYNAPRYTDAAVTVTLSFDALYDCTLPFTAIKQVTFWPAAPETVKPEAREPEKPRGPHLRLVT